MAETSVPAFRLMLQETSEAQVLDAVMRYLAWEPRVRFGPYRINVGLIKNPRDPEAWAGWSIRDVEGKPVRSFPDVLCAVGGRLVVLECKRPSKSLTDAQERFRAYCEAAGVVHGEVKSLDDAVAVIKAVP